MKKGIAIFGLLSTCLLYSQTPIDKDLSIDTGHTGNVGINMVNGLSPQKTLDVDGTVRLATPGDYTDKMRPLAWDNTSQQVVTLDPPTTGDPFTIKRIKYTEPSNNNLDKSLNIDLGISTEKYDVSLMNVSLSNSLTNRPPFMHIYSVGSEKSYRTKGYVYKSNNDPSDLNRLSPVKAYYSDYYSRSVLASANYYHDENEFPLSLKRSLHGDDSDGVNGYANLLFYEVTKYKIVAENGTWHLQGGYTYSTPLNNGDNEWIIEVLAIDKNWAKKEPVIIMKIGADSKTVTETITGNNPPIPDSDKIN